ncbi:MAG: hypothetical protein ABIJ34_09415, partial [archaeon]
IGILLAILLVAGVCAMADEVSGEDLFADIDISVIDSQQLEQITGARVIREDASESIAYSRDETDYKYGRSYKALVGRDGKVDVKGPDVKTRTVVYRITSARQTSKETIQVEYTVYRITKMSRAN